MGAGASATFAPPTEAADLLTALDELNSSAQAVPLQDLTAAQLSLFSRRCIELSQAADAIAKAKTTNSSTSSSVPPIFPCVFPMHVMRWQTFEALDHIPRSDEAQKKNYLTDLASASSTTTCIFISHSWWERETPDNIAPDFASGAKKNLKFKTICSGIRALIEREGIDPAHLTLWLDYFSIDQVDAAKKELGVQSMLYYASKCEAMLIPVQTPHVVTGDFKPGDDPDDHAAYYPEDVADYGARGWCRVEFFLFSLYFEMRHGCPDALKPLRLYAAAGGGGGGGGSGVAELQQFKVVEFLGGDRGDMPSQGAFSFESDRQNIVQLEDRMISAFGHEVLKQASVAAETDPVVDLGAKMLRDEHMPTLAALIQAGGFKAATTLSFNACPMIQHLPSLDGMDALKTLSLINAHALKTLPDLSKLPSLQHVKLEHCDQLEALPKLREGLEYVDAHLPKHLRSAPVVEEEEEEE